jgi:predicted cupin superfamily sugar epimerase
MSIIRSAAEIIQKLQLEPHIEGGYYKRTYTASNAMMSSIFYMLTKDKPIGYFHKNKSDIIHYFHDGDPVRYYVLTENGILTTQVMGRDLNQGQKLQLVVTGGSWKASELLGEKYALISEAVTPEFKFEDHQMATAARFEYYFPQYHDELQHLIKKSG